MDKIKDFFSELGYGELIEKLNNEDADAKTIANEFQSEFGEVLSGDIERRLKNEFKEKEDQKYKGIRNTLFQQVKSGLNLSEIGNVKDYEDVKEFMTAVNDEVSGRLKGTDDELRKKYEGLVQKHNSQLTEFEQLQTKYHDKENEFVSYKSQLENEIKTRQKYDQLFEKYEFGVSDVIKNDYKNIWWDELRENFKVNEDNLSLTDKDGSFVVVDKRKVDTLKDWLDINIKSRGLEKQNNGRQTGRFNADGQGSDERSDRLRQWEQAARERGVSEETIETYLKNKRK